VSRGVTGVLDEDLGKAAIAALATVRISRPQPCRRAPTSDGSRHPSVIFGLDDAGSSRHVECS
jgi:hypothetical protein